MEVSNFECNQTKYCSLLYIRWLTLITLTWYKLQENLTPPSITRIFWCSIPLSRTNLIWTSTYHPMMNTRALPINWLKKKKFIFNQWNCKKMIPFIVVYCNFSYNFVIKLVKKKNLKKYMNYQKKFYCLLTLKYLFIGDSFASLFTLFTVYERYGVLYAETTQDQGPTRFWLLYHSYSFNDVGPFSVYGNKDILNLESLEI